MQLMRESSNTGLPKAGADLDTSDCNVNNLSAFMGDHSFDQNNQSNTYVNELSLDGINTE